MVYPVGWICPGPQIVWCMCSTKSHTCVTVTNDCCRRGCVVRCRAVVCCQARDVDGTVRAHEKRYVPSFRVLFFHLISRQVESIDESSQSRLGPADLVGNGTDGAGGGNDGTTFSIWRCYYVVVFQGAVVPSTLDCSVCSNTPTDLFRSCKETGTLYFPCLTPAPLVTLLKAHDHGTDRTQQRSSSSSTIVCGWKALLGYDLFHSVHCN